jgi:Mg2+-importing ATPase
VLPWLPFADHLGFVAPPPAFYAILAGIVTAYLTCVYWAKRWFYRHWERQTGAAR